MNCATRSILLTAAGIVLLGACQPKASVGSPAPSQSGEALACAPTVGVLPQGTHMTAITGDYRLTLVAKSGAHAGQSTTGTLRINAPSGSGGIDSLTGTGSIALDAVGATAPGRGAADVTVTEWMMSSSSGAMTPQITVRLGRLSAPPGTRAIEGPHMALSVNTVSATGFSGTWSSGSGDPAAADVTGHFCAEKR